MSQPYYMTRPAELAKQPDAAVMFERIAEAAGDPDVFPALWSLWDFEHALDDVIDSGKFSPEICEKLLKHTHDFVGACLATPPDTSVATYYKTLFVEHAAEAGFAGPDLDLAYRALENFAGNLCANPFYRKHAAAHKAMFDMMLMRCIAGDEMAQAPDAFRRSLAPAVRCGDIDFLVHVAMLAGGWDLARKITSLRDYDRPN